VWYAREGCLTHRSVGALTHEGALARAERCTSRSEDGRDRTAKSRSKIRTSKRVRDVSSERMERGILRLAALSVLVVCSFALAASAGASVTRSAHTWHDRSGLAISYPAAWHLTTRSLTTITQPVQRFVVYSGALPPHLAQVASPSAKQALAVVMEQSSVSASDLKQFPRRPNNFRVSHFGGMESFAGDRWAERTFRESGRAFYVFIWVGADDTQQIPTLLNVLDSFRVD
jgi:hypothetical protein